MSTWATILISIGVVSIVVSLMSPRHSASDDPFVAVHQGMTDEDIGNKIRHRRWRVEAKLGIQYGTAFVVLGIAWQLFVYLCWF